MKARHFHNYRLIIEKGQMSKGKRAVYNAYCPALGIADFGGTIDGAIANITKLISFHVESLSEMGYLVPDERDATTVITSVSIPVSTFHKLANI